MFPSAGDNKGYLVAVSGGIDSVVLLHKLVSEGGRVLVVAHFDHGIRSDSAADARFVEALAAWYELPFVMKREELGEKASEELARRRRYEFLRYEAKKRGLRLVTAHHADDIIETIAINLLRGTGWRGIAVLAASDITRPQLYMTKQQLRDYALEHRLEWVEDSTNATPVYLRNRLRRHITSLLLPAQKSALLDVWHRQVELRASIDDETVHLLQEHAQSRYFFTLLDDASALELLRAVILQVNSEGLTRPRLDRALIAIKTARPGTVYEAGSGILLRFTTHTFVVEAP